MQCSVALRGEKDEGEEMEVVVSKVEVKVAKKVNREDNTMVRLHREGSGEERSGRRRRKGKRRKSENIFWIPFRKNGVQDKEMEAEAGVGDEEAEVEGWRRWWSQDRWQGGIGAWWSLSALRCLSPCLLPCPPHPHQSPVGRFTMCQCCS